jgi:hypothetical protein
LHNAFGAQAGFGFGEIVFDGALGSDPLDVARDALLEGGLRLVADGADARNVGDEGADFAGAKLAAGERLERDAELRGDDAGETGRPSSWSLVATSRFARAMSSTKQRSRVWLPSS